MYIETSLLREKFDLKEKHSEETSKPLNMVTLSNRMVLTLQAGKAHGETFVIRAQNMHGCARFASVLVSEYDQRGPLLNRDQPVMWNDLWDRALSSFERLHNPDKWVGLYHKGTPVFSEGCFPPFLDIIEKCDVVNKGNYEDSLKLAEDVFLKAGRTVSIRFDSNVALVCNLSKAEGRCSMIIRGPGRTNTFSFHLLPPEGDTAINLTHGLSISADILEAVQLCYSIGRISAFLEMGHIEKFGDDYLLMKEAKKRLSEIQIQLGSTENRYNVRYRPERPDFEHIITMTERFIYKNPPLNQETA